MSTKLQKYIVNNNKGKTFSNKTFSEFRNDLLKYANEFYSENIIDFSESSIGGMFLDFAAIVGDSLVYYAEQQFNEMNYETATDPENISRFLRQAGIENINASPSSVELDFIFNIPALTNGEINKDFLPKINKNATFLSNNGTNFILTEDVDFNETYIVRNVIEDINRNITHYRISKKGLCTSGTIESESIVFSDDAGKFLSFELENDEITKILSVYDNDNNEYFEVEHLTQDFIFQKVSDSDGNYITLVPSPYRYILEKNVDTNTITLRFGNGDNTSFTDGIIPDVTELILPLKHNEYLNKESISPSKILNSNLLGISPKGKTITVTYKYGGGKSHNISANSITKIEDVTVLFPNIMVEDPQTETVRNSLAVNNEQKATGGSSKPTIDELKMFIKNSKNMQARIVTYEDLLTQLLAFPSDFGKIYKAAALDNDHFVGIKDIFLLCKNNNDYLETPSDALKKNISRFINEKRLIGNNFNLLDVPIFNFGIKLKIKINKGFNVTVTINNILNEIVENMNFKNLHIGQAIDVNKIIKIIQANPAIHTILTPKNKIIVSKSSQDGFFDFDRNIGLEYNINRFNPISDYDEGLIYPVRGGIFELKYPANDIEILFSN